MGTLAAQLSLQVSSDFPQLPRTPCADISKILLFIDVKTVTQHCPLPGMNILRTQVHMEVLCPMSQILGFFLVSYLPTDLSMC